MPQRLLPLLAAVLCLLNVRGLGTEIPFTYENGFILVALRTPGAAESLTFLVDSGASESVLHTVTARRLHVHLGVAEQVSGVEAEAVASRMAPMTVSSGLQPCDQVRLVMDLSNAQPLCGRQIDGLLGMGFFAGRVVQIDFQARKLRVGPVSEDLAATAVPLREQNGVLCASVAVNGSRPRWTRLDTGCNEALHWVVRRGGDRARRSTTIGFQDAGRDVTRASVQLGTLALADVETSLHGRPLFPGEAGLLGNGLLEKYLVTIDAPGQRLLLREVR